MATNRAKLSLRRKNKEAGSVQPSAAESRTTAPTTTHPSGGVAAKKIGGVSGLPDRWRHNEGEGKDDSEDFRPQPIARAAVGKKRRLPQSETVGYLDAVSDDQFQLALAMSASLQPSSSSSLVQSETLTGPREKKRARHGKGRASELPASVITTSATEKQRILAQRASAILQEVLLSGRAPAAGAQSELHPSRLGRRVRGESAGKSSTLWEMAGYSERDTHTKFLVPALELPASENPSSPSPQPSPAAHTPSPQPSPAAHTPHTPSPPPPSHPHISRSPQCSPSSQTHISSRSPHRSTTSHLHTLHPSPGAPSTQAHPSPRPPSLPRGVQTLLSDLSSLVGSQLCSDVIITVEDGRGIPAHSAILACRCPMLAERLFHSLDKPVRLDFSQYSRATVVSFLRYLYTGSIPSSQNGSLKSVKLLAMSLGMLEPLEEMEEQHPLVQSHTNDSEQRVKTTPSSLSTLGDGSNPLLPAGPRYTRGMFISPSPPHHEALPTNKATHPRREAPPTKKPHCRALDEAFGSEPSPHAQHSEDVQMATAEDVISVCSSPTELPTPHQSTSPPPHQSTSPPPHQSTSPPPHQMHTLSPPHYSRFPEQTPSPPPPQSHSSPHSPATVIVSPLPLLERISKLVSVPPRTVTMQGPSHSESHDKPTGSHDKSTGSHDASHDHPNESQGNPSSQPSTSCSILIVTPAPTATRQRVVLESDTEVTPMADYSNLDTPHLKGECSKFGVRALPKKKMIAKLTEIYDYTHPLTDQDGNIVGSVVPAATEDQDGNIVSSVVPAATSKGKKREGGRGRGKKKDSSEKPGLEELAAKVREVITKDTKLYEDMLMYKPLELTYIQSRLRAGSLAISRDSLMDVLDHLCITFSVPRQNQQSKPT